MKNLRHEEARPAGQSDDDVFDIVLAAAGQEVKLHRWPAHEILGSEVRGVVAEALKEQFEG